MNLLILLIIVLFGAFLIIVAVLYIRRDFKENIEAMRKEVGDGIWKTVEMGQKQYSESAKIIQNVSERLAKLDETNRQVLDFSKQLESLQDTLKNPKQRGVFGEYYLETLLKNAFHGKQYKMQYQFKNGETVDAALFFGNKIIPIDSKFSLETYNRLAEEKNPSQREALEKQFIQDLKHRIEETAKYIRPHEGTMDFAFMFIPAEGIYYDLLVNKIGTVKGNTRDLIDYAVHEKNVHIVSPTTFYVTLQSLWQGMKAYQIQEKTKEIIKNVGLLSKHLRVYEEHVQRLGAQLGTTVRTYNTAYKELAKIDKDIVRLAGDSPEIEVMQIEKPEEND